MVIPGESELSGCGKSKKGSFLLVCSELEVEMPVVLTDKSNRVWCVEQPTDGLLHVGWTGNAGPALIDILEFIRVRQKQFDKFQARQEELRNKARRRVGDQSAAERTVGL